MQQHTSQRQAQSVMITGASSGIGLAIARAFASAGCHLMIGGREAPEEVQTLLTELSIEGAKSVHYNNADMADGEAVRAMVAAAHHQMGSLDVLVNNAGIQHVAPVEDFPANAWQQVIDINLSAPFHAIAAAVPLMRDQGFGRIINIASVHGLVASVHKSAYVAAKHGLVGLTKTVALELARTPVTCNAICPAWVRTPLVEAQIEKRAADSGRSIAEEADLLVSEKQPTGRFVQPEDIAQMALYLTQPAASSISGSSFTLDGGWTAQ
ncbi:MAG: 3-hydroxybutyrate dehydrogenase [Candidatus Puniceispirillaceae bacterium]